MKRALILTLALVSLTAVGAAQAHAACLPHDDAVARLRQLHGETVKGLGLDQRGQSVLELFVSESGSWTILMTRTNGLSCITASGQDWMPTAETTENTEDPA